MSLDALLIAELLALGAAVGFMAGLLGVGGGMLLVPFMTLIVSNRGVDTGLAVKMAIATSMATILFTSLSSVRAHHARGAVRWDLVRTIAPGIVAGGLLAGAGAFALLKGRWLGLLFGVFIALMATQMLLARPPRATRRLPGAGGPAAMGGVIGFVSGLVGAGGAFLSVPWMTRGNVPMHQAVGTSAALGFPIALANTAGYLIAGWTLPPALPGAVGYLFVPALVVVSLASVATAPLGARASHAMDVRQLKRIFAFMLYGLASYMFAKAWLG
ncbi:sulfite exporter TauE/SafE family protein [Azohydromonas sediminis]|uniref:sulfite exporter TauE/SafE family protein n=1 Tax=Azohydromonas sediminis TaxID=2259674 RepID=UPI000E656659|nr:sulfite exporter TauE/SafE family protein [Azohydromonas sediminis]